MQNINTLNQSQTTPAATISFTVAPAVPAQPAQLPVKPQAKPARIVRRIEFNRIGQKIEAVYCDGWAV